jgi:hypothetical protein
LPQSWGLSYPKIPSGDIRILGQNRCIVEGDVCDLAFARNVIR